MAETNDRIDSLDHVAVMSEDLTAMGAAYERLGFQLTPLSQHSGARTAGGAVEPWATGNRCIMLRRGYIELMGIVVPGLYDNGLSKFVARYEGVHILAFGCNDAQGASDRLKREGFDVTGIHGLARELDVPNGRATAKFNLVRLPSDEMPESRVLAIEHLTPEHLWQDRYLDHPNGAVGLTALAVCVADVEEAAARYGRMFGVTATGDKARRTFDLAAGRFTLLSEAALKSELGLDAPILPFAASFTVAVTDPGKARAVMEQAGICCTIGEGGFTVSPHDACGALVVVSSNGP
jgi:hypothetical protein